MFELRKRILITIAALPAVLSCSDNASYVFGSYVYIGVDKERTCEWIVSNPKKVSIRRQKWCGPFEDGTNVKEECPLACGACPDASPSVPPTQSSSESPTVSPTVSFNPTTSPTRPPSPAPSPFPTARPSSSPSAAPTDFPSVVLSDSPTSIHSLYPSSQPSTSPSIIPSVRPSAIPSSLPSTMPFSSPSVVPTTVPTVDPTNPPTDSIKPSPSPSAAPFLPTLSPTISQAPTSKPTGECVDSTLRIKIIKHGQIISRSCEWVARRDRKYRCKMDGVSAACPATCGSCNVCEDPIIKFKFEYNNKFIVRDCDFIGRIAGKVFGRCRSSGNICRKSCGVCQ